MLPPLVAEKWQQSVAFFRYLEYWSFGAPMFAQVGVIFYKNIQFVATLVKLQPCGGHKISAIGGFQSLSGIQVAESTSYTVYTITM